MSAAKDLAGISEAFIPTDAGSHLLSFKIDDSEAYTLATFTKPSFATLVTLSLDDEDAPQLAQYVLPIGHLHAHELRYAPLHAVLQLAQATRLFRSRRNLQNAAPQIALSQSAFGTVPNVIALTMAIYECLRRNDIPAARLLLNDLQAKCSDVPDLPALRVLCQLDQELAHVQIPLFFDGLRAVGLKSSNQIDAARFDYGSLWTAWRGAV